jgi:hypothetical protein
VLVADEAKTNVAFLKVRPTTGFFPELTATRVVSDEHVEEEPVKREIEKGEAPPEKLTLASSATD